MLPTELWRVIAIMSNNIKSLNISCKFIHDSIYDITLEYYNPLLPLLYLYPDAPWHIPALVTNLCLPILYVQKHHFTNKIYTRKDAITLNWAPPQTHYMYATHDYLQKYFPNVCRYDILYNSNLTNEQFLLYKTGLHNNSYNLWDSLQFPLHRRHYCTLKEYAEYGAMINAELVLNLTINDIIDCPHALIVETITSNPNITLADIYYIDTLNIFDIKLINYVFACPNLSYIELEKLLCDPDIINDFYMLSHNNFNR